MSCSGPEVIQSKITEAAIVCPSCGQVNDVVMWDVLEAKCNPERTAQLATGELLVHTCAHCGVLVPLDYPLFYVDRDRKVAAYYPAGKGELDAVATLFVQANQRFHGVELVTLRKQEVEMRITPNRFELAEKVTAWQGGLNDKLLEVFKALLLRELGERNPERGFCEIQLVAVHGEQGPEQQLEFVLFARQQDAAGKPEVVPAGSGITMPRAAYARLTGDVDLRCAMDRTYAPVVDPAWARAVLAEVEGQK